MSKSQNNLNQDNKKRIIDAFRGKLLEKMREQDLSMKKLADKMAVESGFNSTHELLHNIVYSSAGTSVQNAMVIARALRTTVGELLPAIKSDEINNCQSYMLLHFLMKRGAQDSAIIAERISQEMKLKGVSIAQLSEATRLSPSAIQALTSRLSSFHASITTLWLTADALSVEINAVLPNENTGEVAEKLFNTYIKKS